jgi:aryl-alcohol dehydrogenase-like predicted oxidoreductase
VQIEYSPFSTDIESPQIGLLETCRELGVAIVAYSPLSRGLLAGQIKSPEDFEEGDVRRILPRFSADNFKSNMVLVDALKDIAVDKRCSAAQLTLAWLMARGRGDCDIFPIPG